MSLGFLAAMAATPILVAGDPDQTILIKEFVLGPTLRDLLVAQGARILSVQTENDLTLGAFTPAQRIEAVWKRGRDHFDSL